ncbi:MAG TPA: class I SAM-dependent methyltransferase [Candidatus Limnocylindrales bacterium]|nr:class I SAM-dependent methyltransferase [Candidatus Limnocylindrales bacterium]
MTNQDIDGGRAFDWGRVSRDYAQYRDIYPEEFYQRIVDLGLCTSGQRVLDLGTGTGVLPRNLYRFGAQFVGADISGNQIAEAVRLSHAGGMAIEYVVSSAEAVEFPPASFDVVTACQCFVYFDQMVVLPRIHALLKEDGHFCVLWMAWLPDEDQIAHASEQLVLKHNPAWTGASYQRGPVEMPEWSQPLFSTAHAIAYDIRIPFTRESWHGRIKACRGIGASSLSNSEIEAFEAEHRELLRAFPEQFKILHHVVMLDLSRKP